MTSTAYHPMFIPLLLMAIIAPLGGVDIIYYHLWKFRLYRQPSATAENATHVIRGLSFGVVMMILFNYEPHGAWFWFIAAIFSVDFANGLADIYLEPRSRASLGGVPRVELLVHATGEAFAGAITVAFFIFGWQYHAEPTALAPIADSSLPGWLRMQKYVLVPSALGLTLFEAALFARSCFNRDAGNGRTAVAAPNHLDRAAATDPSSE